MTDCKTYLFDTHCHLDQFSPDYDIGKVIIRAQKAGVKRFFVPGVTGFPERVVDLVKFPQILIGWGIHPLYAEKFVENCSDEIATVLKKSLCCAIGECGLDRRAPVKFAKQCAVFQWQINLAFETGMPLIIHLVGHYETAWQMLQKASNKLRFVLHSFAGSFEIAKRFLDIGAYISFSGTIFQKNSEVLSKLVQIVPADRLLFETDSPYQRPFFWPGKINEPASLKEIAARLAEIRHISLNELCTQVNQNCAKFFNY